MNEFVYPISQCGRIFQSKKRTFSIVYEEYGCYYELKPGDVIFVLVTFHQPDGEGYHSDFYQYVVDYTRFHDFRLYPTSEPLGLPAFHGSSMVGLYACTYPDVDFPIKGGEITAKLLEGGNYV